jgi:putative endonuclease
MKDYYVYILTNKFHTTLYIGVTNNLERRLYEHRNKLVKGFTSKYNLAKLVHIEQTGDALAAITREKQLKGWTRAKKMALVESTNPQWRDLSEDWYKPATTPPLSS